VLPAAPTVLYAAPDAKGRRLVIMALRTALVKPLATPGKKNARASLEGECAGQKEHLFAAFHCLCFPLLPLFLQSDTQHKTGQS
jgi:hypothetical protein